MRPTGSSSSCTSAGALSPSSVNSSIVLNVYSPLVTTRHESAPSRLRAQRRALKQRRSVADPHERLGHGFARNRPQPGSGPTAQNDRQHASVCSPGQRSRLSMASGPALDTIRLSRHSIDASRPWLSPLAHRWVSSALMQASAEPRSQSGRPATNRPLQKTSSMNKRKSAVVTGITGQDGAYLAELLLRARLQGLRHVSPNQLGQLLAHRGTGHPRPSQPRTRRIRPDRYRHQHRAGSTRRSRTRSTTSPRRASSACRSTSRRRPRTSRAWAR